MFPPQTSLIPTQIALARFLESQGWQAIFTNYPYWYFGTTPFRHLTGPIFPSVISLLHKIVPASSYFDIIYLLIFIGWIVGILGVFYLSYGLSEGKKGISITSSLIYGFFPIMPILFRFSNGISFITYSFLPVFFYLFLKYIKGVMPDSVMTNEDEEEKFNLNNSLKQEVLICGLMTFLILLYSQIIPTLILGMVIFILSLGKNWGVEQLLKRSLKLFLMSLALSTIWYGLGYWLTLLGAPSFGGKSLLSVFGSLTKLLPIAIVLVFAGFSSKITKSKNEMFNFSFYWLTVFLFLTLIRFLSDPDYWQDWTGYSWEIQFGFALLLASLLKDNLKLKIIVILIVIVTWGITLDNYLLKYFQKNLKNSLENKVGTKLSEIAKDNDLVYLTGTSAYWLNFSFDIKQVRGGIDQAANNKEWQVAAWQLKEGEEVDKAVKYLVKNKVKYLVVHTDESKEYYHDFKDPEGLEAIKGLKKVYEDQGDIIYQIEDK